MSHPHSASRRLSRAAERHLGASPRRLRMFRALSAHASIERERERATCGHAECARMVIQSATCTRCGWTGPAPALHGCKGAEATQAPSEPARSGWADRPSRPLTSEDVERYMRRSNAGEFDRPAPAPLVDARTYQDLLDAGHVDEEHARSMGFTKRAKR